MLEPRRECDLALEALHRHVAGHFGREDLHHDLSAEGALGGHEHLRHPTPAQFTIELVGVAE